MKAFHKNNTSIWKLNGDLSPPHHRGRETFRYEYGPEYHNNESKITSQSPERYYKTDHILSSDFEIAENELTPSFNKTNNLYNREETSYIVHDRFSNGMNRNYDSQNKTGKDVGYTRKFLDNSSEHDPHKNSLDKNQPSHDINNNEQGFISSDFVLVPGQPSPGPTAREDASMCVCGLPNEKFCMLNSGKSSSKHRQRPYSWVPMSICSV